MYIVIEIQKSNDSTVAIVPPASYADINQAESALHAALSAAAVSSVPVHSAIMIDDTGVWMKGETYYHGSVEA